MAAVEPNAATVHRLSADDLDELLTRADVSNPKRAACLDEINQLFRWYDARLAGNTRTNEASQAESLRVVAAAARELAKVLALLPPGLRRAVEPDYSAHVRKGFALHVLRATARAAAAKELAARDPDAQWLADQTASLPQSAREDVKRQESDLLSRARAALPLEVILPALIEAADKAGAAMEKRVSGTWSRSRGILARNELALNLKAIAIGHSTKLANDQRAAEDWAALVLDSARIHCPIRETNPAAFAKMFIPAIH